MLVIRGADTSACLLGAVVLAFFKVCRTDLALNSVAACFDAPWFRLICSLTLWCGLFLTSALVKANRSLLVACRSPRTLLKSGDDLYLDESNFLFM